LYKNILVCSSNKRSLEFEDELNKPNCYHIFVTKIDQATLCKASQRKGFAPNSYSIIRHLLWTITV